MKDNHSVSVYTGSLKLEIQIGSLSGNPKNAWREISPRLSGPHSERATARWFVRRIHGLFSRANKRKKKKKSQDEILHLYEFSFTASWFFEILHTKGSSLKRFSDSSRVPKDPRTTSWVSWSMRKTQGDASYSNALFETEYSLMMVSRGEVLGARWCSVARIGAVQGMLREETAIVLVHSTGPESRALRELNPGPVLRLELGLHGRWGPL